MRTLNNYLDLRLFSIILAISAIGLVMIASATDVNIHGMTRQVQFQMISFCIGLIAMVVIMFINYRWMGHVYWLFYVLTIGALALVFIPGLGVEIAGATRWINLGVMDFQTSEIAKLGMIIFFAKLFEKRSQKLQRIQELILPVLCLVPLLILLWQQPDLGTILLFCFLFAGIAFVSGINLKIVALVILAGILTLPIAYNFLGEHQRQRIDAFLNPNDPSLVGYYQVAMSKITIGSGRVTGNGLFKGGFSANSFLPVQETDFIFAVLVEEMGFVGGIVLIGLYFLLISRLVGIAYSARDGFGSNIVIGITFMFAFQIIVNIGMTMGVMPVTGLVLPFVSYGGSSMLVNMMAIGLVMNVYMRRRRVEA